MQNIFSVQGRETRLILCYEQIKVNFLFRTLLVLFVFVDSSKKRRLAPDSGIMLRMESHFRAAPTECINRVRINLHWFNRPTPSLEEKKKIKIPKAAY